MRRDIWACCEIQWSNPFACQQGVTHALFSSVNHPGGNLVIGVPDVAGFESVNGLQVVLIPEPASLGVTMAGALFLGASSPGRFY